MTAPTIARSARLRPADLARLSTLGIRSRPLRAALSALGIAIGVAALVAVVGFSSSSRAGLLSEIDALGTNLLTVSTGSTIFGEPVPLPVESPAMIGRVGQVQEVQSTGRVDANVYRNELIPTVNTNALAVQAVTLGLLETIGTTLADGVFLNEATAGQPVAVLGAAAAQRLGIDRVYVGERILVGGQWFYLAGILEPAVLAPEIDSAVLIGIPAATTYLGFDGHPTVVYVRTATDHVESVRPLLAPTANPAAPSEVNVSRPSDALVARALAQSALSSLVLGVGAISLLVGGVGVANTMIIAVLERRSEIGLRRALGATRNHIRAQFIAEATLLGLVGGAAGLAVGALSVASWAALRGWPVSIPIEAWAGGLAAAVVIGAIAGLAPAIRAARLSPKEALWSM